MTFLHLNGWEIPVIESSLSVEHDEIGQRTRAFAGNPLVERRATKRKIKFRTRPLTELVGRALVGLLRGEGHLFPFNKLSSDLALVDQYSTKGLAPSTAVSYGHLRMGTGQVGGHPVYDIETNLEGKFGSDGAIEVADAVTNLIGSTGNWPNVSDGTDTAANTNGWVGLGGSPTISSSTDVALAGARSLKVAGASFGQGAEVSPDWTIPTPGNSYAISAYVYCATASKSVRMLINGDFSGSLLTQDESTGTGGRWIRMSGYVPTNASDTTLEIQFINNSAGSLDFYVDCVMIEDGTHASAWKHSTSARTAGALAYPIASFRDYMNATVAFWAKAHPDWAAGVTALFNLGYNSTGMSAITVDATDEIRMTVDPWSVELNYDVGWADGDWHHIACVMRQSFEAGEANSALYVDGVLRASDVTNPVPAIDPNDWLGFYVGQNNGSLWFEGSLDELIVVPYAMAPDQIAALHAATKAPAPLPQFYVGGTAIPDIDERALFIGRAEMTLRSAQIDGVWRDNAYVVQATLDEV